MTHSSAALPIFIDLLSARELEVLMLLTRGATNQTIADELHVTLHTAKKHTSNIFAKLGVPNRTQAAHLAHTLGWVA